MTENKDDNMIVTIRMKRKVADLFKIILIKSGMTVTEELTKHIASQSNKYKIYENNLSIEDESYSKINIRINRELYTQYKVQMVLNHTTPTADVIRFVLWMIEKNQDKLNDIPNLKDM